MRSFKFCCCNDFLEDFFESFLFVFVLELLSEKKESENEWARILVLREPLLIRFSSAESIVGTQSLLEFEKVDRCYYEEEKGVDIDSCLFGVKLISSMMVTVDRIGREVVCVYVCRDENIEKLSTQSRCLSQFYLHIIYEGMFSVQV